MSRSLQIMVAVGAIAGAVAAYWFLALGPKREQAAKLETDIATKQSEVSEVESTVAAYENAKGAFRENYATVVRLGKAVPGDDDVRSLVVQLDDTAKRTGVDFRQITVGGSGSAPAGPSTAAPNPAGGTPPPGAVAVGAAGFYAMPFNFSFEGGFFKLSSFLTELERYVRLSNDRIDVTGRLLRLDSLSLSPKGEGMNEIKAEIGASSYLVPPGEGVTAGATPQGPAPAAKPAAPQGGSGTAPTTTATVGVLR